MISRSVVPLALTKSRWLKVAGLLLSTLMSISSAFADNAAATVAESPVSAIQKSEPVSSTAASIPADAVALVNEKTESQFNQKPDSQLNQKTDPQQAAAKTPPKIGSSGHLLNVVLGLVAIIALIFVLSQFVKRFGSGSFSANSQLKILSSMPLGTRERIVLIDAGGQQLLLGITPTSINTLHVFLDPIVIDNKTEAPSDFSRKLMAILQQKPSAPSSNDKHDSAPQG
jgi:flagellar protein FliO/FliZ